MALPFAWLIGIGAPYEELEWFPLGLVDDITISIICMYMQPFSEHPVHVLTNITIEPFRSIHLNLLRNFTIFVL